MYIYKYINLCDILHQIRNNQILDETHRNSRGILPCFSSKLCEYEVNWYLMIYFIQVWYLMIYFIQVCPNVIPNIVWIHLQLVKTPKINRFECDSMIIPWFFVQRQHCYCIIICRIDSISWYKTITRPHLLIFFCLFLQKQLWRYN